MADTLEKIYEGSLQESDFNSSGVATIITTNTSTRHVIKDVKVKQGDADINIGGTLSVNDFDIADLSGNSTGSQIIGTSSTVKVTTSEFPLTYEDVVLQYQPATTTIEKLALPFVNNVSGKASNETTNASYAGWSNISLDDARREYWTGIGASNYGLYFFTDYNATNTAGIVNSSGTLVTSLNATYQPIWFDGTQYAYRSANSYLYRADISAGQGFNTYIPATQNVGNTTYPKCFGYEDKYVIAWNAQATNGGVQIYDLQNQTSRYLLSSGYSASGAFGSSVYPFYLVRVADDDYKMVRVASTSGWNYWDFDPAIDTFTGNSIPSTSIDLGVGKYMNSYQAAAQAIGSRIYYLNTNLNISYYDFATKENGTITTSIAGTYGSMPYGADLWGTKITPTSSTVSGRTYNISPSLDIQITGVTST